MLAARLDTQITFEKETTAPNSIGTPVETYTTLKTKWATVTYGGGRTFGDLYAERTYTDTIFTIRYDAEIDYKCRILYNSSYYKIEHIEVLQRKRGMRIRTTMLEIND